MRYNRNRYSSGMGLIGIVVVILLAIGGFFVFSAAYKSTERDVTITVEDKERVCNGSEGCEYLVFTDEGTFKLTDTLIYGRFDTSDVYGRIDEGETYDAKVAGWRFGFLSMYPNIIELDEARQ